MPGNFKLSASWIACRNLRSQNTTDADQRECLRGTQDKRSREEERRHKKDSHSPRRTGLTSYPHAVRCTGHGYDCATVRALRSGLWPAARQWDPSHTIIMINYRSVIQAIRKRGTNVTECKTNRSSSLSFPLFWFSLPLSLSCRSLPPSSAAATARLTIPFTFFVRTCAHALVPEDLLGEYDVLLHGVAPNSMGISDVVDIDEWRCRQNKDNGRACMADRLWGNHNYFIWISIYVVELNV